MSEDSRAYVVNPEAIGDLDQELVVRVDADETCPMHSQNWLYAAVRNNRRLSELAPQPCTCDTEPETNQPKEGKTDD